jgi:hypothetical protein
MQTHFVAIKSERSVLTSGMSSLACDSNEGSDLDDEEEMREDGTPSQLH